MSTARPPIRLIDIAQEANVSKMTVARVLHNSGGTNVRVSQAVSERVKAIARKMDYQPNTLAQKLAGGRSNTLGVIIDSQASTAMFMTLQHLERQAAARGYRVMVGQAHDDADALVAIYRDLMRHGVDGVICMAHDYPQLGDKHYEALSHEPNLVFVDRPKLPQAAYVELRADWGVEQAVEFLHGRGRRRIGLQLYPTGTHCMLQRLAGYHHALERLGGGQERLVTYIQRPAGPDALARSAEAMVKGFVLDRRLDAIVVGNDLIAGHLIRAMTQQGVRVPQDVSVIGHDNQDFSSCFTPQITSLDQNVREQAEKVVQMCLGLIKGEASQQGRVASVRPRLVVRASA